MAKKIEAKRSHTTSTAKPKETKEKTSSGNFWKKLGNFVRDSVDCCIE